MLNQNTIALFVSFLFLTGVAQANPLAKQNCSGYYKGTLTLANGKEINAYFYIDHCNPHLFQSTLRMINAKSYKKYVKGKRLKKKVIEKIKLKKINSLQLEDGRLFRTVKYANMYSSKKTDWLPKRHLLEVALDGPIVLYKKHYRTQNGFIYRPVMDSALEGGTQHLEFMLSNFEILIQKNRDENPKNIRSINLKNYIGDQTLILKDYQEGKYAFREQLQRKATFSANCDPVFLEALKALVSDYNDSSRTGVSSTEFDH